MSPRVDEELAPGGFPETRWSRVISARERPEERRVLMEELCRARWQPLYLYARRTGLPADRAEDAVQGLLLQLIEHDFLARLDPSRGKLRGYLKQALRHYLINRHEHEVAAKRGGSAKPLPIDAVEAVLVAAPNDPEAAFDREWAIGVFESALAELTAEYERGDRRGPVAVLRHVFRFEDVAPYEEIARTHGMTVSQVKSFVHRAKLRYRQLVLQRIRDTVASEAEAEAEMADLLRLLQA